MNSAELDQTLAVADIGFEIVSISVNPTGKLLAVIGADQVVVVVLPAPGYGGMAGQKVSCRLVFLGRYSYWAALTCAEPLKLSHSSILLVETRQSPKSCGILGANLAVHFGCWLPTVHLGKCCADHHALN